MTDDQLQQFHMTIVVVHGIEFKIPDYSRPHSPHATDERISPGLVWSKRWRKKFGHGSIKG
ncbi:hypothetical protein Tdes44962_MAKER04315 [Teratosphaeria destructans]|uniref:Uncharacterized protein n=1 Tax=Teratosphaeria destructans TaxID=418781 RepID=A0A9W7SMV2_9PEZI|nr:hypothetical protein Tdes44962_MAKER04315 [Teratosphaeria destructans]